MLNFVHRWMYWTDWGTVAKIERASMDGDARTALFDTDLVWPNGITIDYPEQKIYWTDASLDRIEYSNVDGTGRTILETGGDGLLHPFSITLENDILFWTEWQNQSIFSTHKLLGQTIVPIYETLAYPPNVVEAITPSRQEQGT